MKILIIAPKYGLTNHKEYGYFFPLGLAYISAVIKKEGYDLDCFNLNNYEGKIEDLIKSKLDSANYDIVCTGYIAIGYAVIEKIINSIKEHKSKPKIILGGAIITTEPELIFNALKPDYGVLGEGEIIIIELLKAIEKKNLENVKGICYKNENGKLIITKSQEPIKDLDSLPFPDLEGFGFKEYLDNQPCIFGNGSFTLLDHPRQYQILCSRGCANQCTFCYHILQKYRTRTLENVFEEIEFAIKNYSINILFIEDDLFSVNRERLFEFCKRMKELNDRLGYKILWICSLTVRRIDEKLLNVMKEAGCRVVGYGFESYNQNVLNSMKKPITPEQINDSFYKTIKAGIGLQANFIFGDTAETKETAKETIDWWKKNARGQVSLEFIQPYPGSEIYNRCIQKGIIKDKLDFIKNKLPFINWLNMTDNMADEEILELKNEILELKKYYAYAIPIKTKGIKRKIYDLTVKCPFCKEIVEYKNCFIENRFKYMFFVVCRKCSHRFFIMSTLKKLQMNNAVNFQKISKIYNIVQNKFLKRRL